MEDLQLYQQILGLSAPWRVAKVTLNRAAGELEIEVACTDTLWGCPECQQRMHAHDTDRRRWRHLDSCQFKTMIVCDVPKVRCPQQKTKNGSKNGSVPR
jgi:transposase